MNDTKEFINWKRENREDLVIRYRKYLEDMSADKDFNIVEIENFDEWAEVEFNILKEKEVEK